jgi:3-oxoacyl-[acyl-carrier protein] reductase
MALGQPDRAQLAPALRGRARVRGRHETGVDAHRELGPKGIRSNCISPGTVPTEATKTVGHVTDAQLEATATRIPIRRLGTPTDCGAAAVWLASPAGSWITGQNIVVSGGA